MSGWAHSCPLQLATGSIKQQPDDFLVVEQMQVEPCGEGEHFWLRLQKTKQNTDQVAKALARFAKVAYRDVGYSGLKDLFAVTEQWFSVWLPKGEQPNWDNFDQVGVQILQVSRHTRKIKRGTHTSNRFTINVADLQGDLAALSDRLETIRLKGVPNYFGAQRFGREAGNMNQVLALFSGQKKIKNRSHRSILLSAARAWLFNTVLSARIADDSWDKLLPGEPANLSGSGSVFVSAGGGAEQDRLTQMDIHPTAPMWGQFAEAVVEPYAALHDWEMQQIQPYSAIAQGLQQAGLKYQRRATRSPVLDLSWQLVDNKLLLEFELARGQFATSVLRELVSF